MTAKPMAAARFCISCVIGLALCWAFPVLANVDPVATKKELQQIQRRIQDLQKEIKQTQSRRSATEEALKQSEQAISDTRRKLREVNRAMASSDAKLAELRQSQQKLNRAKEAQRSALKQDINSAYRAGRQEYVKLLLNQEQPDKLARQMKYYDYYHQARMQRIQAFNQTLSEIKANEIQINEEVAQLATLKTELADEQQRLQSAKEQRKQALAKLDDSLKNDASRVTSLKASQSELETVLHRVQATLSDLPSNVGKQPFGKLQGKLAWPSQGSVIKRFGNRRESGSLRWNGVLIRTQEGSPVKAVHHGRVVFSDWMRGFGMLTIVDHGDGYLSLYGHNETLLKGPGDWVQAGEVIAYSGLSGGQDQASLYFEIRKDGKPQNPSRWCRG
ncbi:MAG: peptidoglycan DD-metalloendopeptidase family protein [Pseudomonadota bacterium]|nr:peptidoglycan DD-metalloendopeptidase family protein [Pseudomonadota bacterium]